MTNPDKPANPQTPTLANRERQVREYVESHRDQLRGDNINPHKMKAYFDTKLGTVVFKADYIGFTSTIDHRADTTERETLIPEEVKRLVLHYRASPNFKDHVKLEGNAVTLRTYGSAGTSPYSKDSVDVKGDRNYVDFDTTSSAADLNVYGDRNRVFGTKGDDNIYAGGVGNRIFAGAGNDKTSLSGADNSIWAGAGNDVISDGVFAHDGLPIKWYNEDRRHNGVSGGAGLDTYQLDMLLDQETANDEKNNSITSFRIIDVVFDRYGNALIKQGDKTLTAVNPDVERMEFAVIGTGKDRYSNNLEAVDGIYRVDISALRKAFNEANVRISGEANPDVTPVKIHINISGVSVDAGYNDVPVQKVSRSPY